VDILDLTCLKKILIEKNSKKNSFIFLYSHTDADRPQLPEPGAALEALRDADRLDLPELS
jgi:hypothetical protein